MRALTPVPAVVLTVTLAGCATSPPAPSGGPAWLESAPPPLAVRRAAGPELVCRPGRARGDLNVPPGACRTKSAARLERARAAAILTGARSGYGGSW